MGSAYEIHSNGSLSKLSVIITYLTLGGSCLHLYIPEPKRCLPFIGPFIAENTNMIMYPLNNELTTLLL